MSRFVVALPILLAAGLGAIELQPAGAPEFLQPQLASAYGQVALTYGSGSAIWFASSSNGGRTFAPHVKVANPERSLSGAIADPASPSSATRF